MSSVQALANELPRPTEDLDRCKVDIDRFGYALLANALSASELKRLRARLEEVAAAERADGVAAVYDENGSQVINVFVNKCRPFVDLIEHPKTLPLIAHILGEKRSRKRRPPVRRWSSRYDPYFVLGKATS